MEGTEKINNVKGRDLIREDGYKAAKRAIEEVAKPFVDRGFDRNQVRELIKEGVRKAVNE